MKKAVVFFAILCMLCTVSRGAMHFYDVKADSEGGKAIYTLSEMGIIAGYGNGFFGPEDTLTRAQATKIINRVFMYDKAEKIDFADVKEDAWYYNDVAIAVGAGYIKGYGNGLFGPEDLLTREQVCVMLDNIMNFTMLPVEVTLNDAVSPWAEESVREMLSNFLITTDENGFFRATEEITREEACIILSQFVMAEPPVIPPSDLDNIERKELEGRLIRVITGIRSDLMFKTEIPEIKAVFEAIALNMEKYLENPSFDYKTQAVITEKQYRALVKEHRIEAKTLLVNFFLDSRYIKDLDVLYEFFF